MHDFNFCPKCGERLCGNECFCPGCGYRLANDTSASQAQAKVNTPLPPPIPTPAPEPTPVPVPESPHPEETTLPEPEPTIPAPEPARPEEPVLPWPEPEQPEETALPEPGSARQNSDGRVLGYVNGQFGYYNPEDVDHPASPDHLSPLPEKSSSGMKNVWIAIVTAVVVVAVGLVAWFTLSNDSEPETEKLENAEGEALLTGSNGVKYYFPKDLDRLDAKGDVYRLEESYVSADGKVTTTYEFDSNGYLTASMGEPIGVPNDWGNDFSNPTAKYSKGLLISSQARRPSKRKEANLAYEYKPKDEKTVEVFRIFSDGKRELAMTLNFDDRGMLLTRVEEPYKDTYAYDAKGRQSIYSGEISEDKILKTDDRDNWTEKSIGDGIRIVRRFEYR